MCRKRTRKVGSLKSRGRGARTILTLDAKANVIIIMPGYKRHRRGALRRARAF